MIVVVVVVVVVVVAVIVSATARSATHLGQHLDDADDQREAVFDVLLVAGSDRCERIEDGPTLHRRSSGDTEVAGTGLAGRLAGSLGDVERH